MATAIQTAARRIVHRTCGRSPGPIPRLVSPSDVGELITPFVFLDYFEIDPKRMPPIGSSGASASGRRARRASSSAASAKPRARSPRRRVKSG